MLHSFSAEAVDVGVMWMGDEPLEPDAVRRFTVRGRLAATSPSGRIVDDVDVIATRDGPGSSDAIDRLRLEEVVVSGGVPSTRRPREPADIVGEVVRRPPTSPTAGVMARSRRRG